MENQNSTGHGTAAEAEGRASPPVTKKGFNLHGKRKWIIVICIAVFLLGSCAARGAGLRGGLGWGWGNRGWIDRSSVLMGTGNIIGNTAGISTFAAPAKDFESLGIVFAETTASRRNGYGTTHNALMREAVAKGADAIINVSIAPTSGVFNRTWTGSALAIKYQD